MNPANGGSLSDSCASASFLQYLLAVGQLGQRTGKFSLLMRSTATLPFRGCPTLSQRALFRLVRVRVEEAHKKNHATPRLHCLTIRSPPTQLGPLPLLHWHLLSPTPALSTCSPEHQPLHPLSSPGCISLCPLPRGPAPWPPLVPRVGRWRPP